jgi:hypothetical protein
MAEYESRIPRQQGSTKLMREGVVDNAREVEVETSSRLPSRTRVVTGDYPVSPNLSPVVGCHTCLYLRNTGSIFNAYCGSTFVRNARELRTLNTSIRSLNHKVQKAIRRKRIMSRIREKTEFAM